MYHQQNPLVATRLPSHEIERLERVLRSQGLCLRDWIIVQVDRSAAERLPESQGDVKKIVPQELAKLSREACELQGDFYLRLANATSDQIERKRLRQLAAPWLDAAGWFSTVVEEGRRRHHVLDSGQRQPRHRRKESPSPATDSSSRTTD